MRNGLAGVGQTPVDQAMAAPSTALDGCRTIDP